MRQAKDIGEILEVLVVPGKPLAADGSLIQLQRLNLRPHRAVEHENSLGEEGLQLVGFVVCHGRKHNPNGNSLRIDPVHYLKVRNLAETPQVSGDKRRILCECDTGNQQVSTTDSLDLPDLAHAIK
jgi:hypothetical protein